MEADTMRPKARTRLPLFATLVVAIPCHAASQPSKPPPQPTRTLSFWTVGGGGVSQRFGPGLFEVLDEDAEGTDSVLLSLAEEPLTTALIQERTDLAPSPLEAILERLDRLRVIEQTEDGRWFTTLPVISDERMGGIRDGLVPMARAVAGRLAAEIPRLRARYEEERASTDPEWGDVVHLLVDKFIVDATFHAAIGERERSHGIEGRYSESQRVIEAFFVERGENFSTFGSNWYPYVHEGEQREVYVLHGAVLYRYDIRMNAYRRDPGFRHALFALDPDGGTGALSTEDRVLLRSLEWMDGDRLLVPTVQAETIRALWPVLEEIGGGGADVVFDNYGLILDSFADSPYSKFLDGAGDYIQVCYHVLFGLTLEELERSGAVSGYPDPAPEHVGVFIVMGKLN